MDSGSRPRSAAAVGLSMQAAKQIADSVFLQAEKKGLLLRQSCPIKLLQFGYSRGRTGLAAYRFMYLCKPDVGKRREEDRGEGAGPNMKEE